MKRLVLLALVAVGCGSAEEAGGDGGSSCAAVDTVSGSALITDVAPEPGNVAACASLMTYKPGSEMSVPVRSTASLSMSVVYSGVMAQADGSCSYRWAVRASDASLSCQWTIAMTMVRPSP